MANLNEVRSSNDAASDANVAMKLEAVVIPVSDVDRAKKFYRNIKWRIDADFFLDNGFRVDNLISHGQEEEPGDIGYISRNNKPRIAYCKRWDFGTAATTSLTLQLRSIAHKLAVLGLRNMRPVGNPVIQRRNSGLYAG